MRDVLAEQAIALGLPVFPCGNNKAPFKKGGFKTASTDPAAIRSAFADARARMIGVPTGRVSGLLVVDVDVAEGKSGQAWFDEFEMARTTRQHRTRSGGHHLVFQAPQTRVIPNSAGKIAPAVDVRGDGGYVIFPPSPGYTVAFGGAIEPVPDWLLRVLTPKLEARPFSGPRRDIAHDGSYARRALIRSIDKVARCGEGGRNDQLNKQAFRLGMFVGASLLDLSEVAGELAHAARQAGLTEREIKLTLESGLTAGMRQPLEKTGG